MSLEPLTRLIEQWSNWKIQNTGRKEANEIRLEQILTAWQGHAQNYNAYLANAQDNVATAKLGDAFLPYRSHVAALFTKVLPFLSNTRFLLHLCLISLR
jgi:hypothetical protein